MGLLLTSYLSLQCPHTSVIPPVVNKQSGQHEIRIHSLSIVLLCISNGFCYDALRDCAVLKRSTCLPQSKHDAPGMDSDLSTAYG